MSDIETPPPGDAVPSQRGVAEATAEKLRNRFGDSTPVTISPQGQAVAIIDVWGWAEASKWLASEGGFGFLSDLSVVDRLDADPRFEVVYQLTDLQVPSQLRVKIPIGGEEPSIPSVCEVWPTANWLEREAFDMFGITFEGHPDLTRILMPDEWEGHPLRKDYAMGKVPVEYKHISPGY